MTAKGTKGQQMKPLRSNWGWNLLLAVIVVGAVGNLILAILNLVDWISR